MPSTSLKKEIAKTEIGPSSPPPHDLYGANKPSKLCRSCDRPAKPKIVGPENENGNVGRHYYACENKVCNSILIRDGVLTDSSLSGLPEL